MKRLHAETSKVVAAATLACLLAVVHTWPLAAAPHRHSLNYHADAELNAWIVSWIAYALPHEPGRLYAGNIFQPDSHALAYSEPLFVPAIVGAPIRWLGGSAVLTFNILLVLGLAATAFAGWFVASRWTGSWWAGTVAGSLLAFNTHLLTRLPHLQAAHAWGLPLAAFFTDRILALPDHARRRDVLRSVALLVAVVATVAMTSEYWLVFTGAIIATQSAVGVRSRRSAARMAVAVAGGVVLALPMLVPYLQLAAEGIRRPIEQAAQLSATPRGYLVSMSRLDALWSRQFFTRDIDVLFPGVAALALAAAAMAGMRDEDAATKRRIMTLAAVAALGFLFSLGPSTPIYPIAYRFVAPLQALRVPARFGYLVLFSVAMLASVAIARLLRGRSTNVAASAGLLSLVVVNAEAWHGPVQVMPFRGVPRIYQMLAGEPKPLLLVEAPFWPAEAVFGNAEYVLNATEHHLDIANGYSGFTPDSYRRRAQWFWFFPEPWAIATMRPEGVTHVMVHLEQFGNEAPRVLATLAVQHDLELMADDGNHRLYRFIRR